MLALIDLRKALVPPWHAPKSCGDPHARSERSHRNPRCIKQSGAHVYRNWPQNTDEMMQFTCASGTLCFKDKTKYVNKNSSIKDHYTIPYLYSLGKKKTASCYTHMRAATQVGWADCWHLKKLLPIQHPERFPPIKWIKWIHSQSLRWTLQSTHLKRKFIFQPSLFRVYVKLQGCKTN